MLDLYTRDKYEWVADGSVHKVCKVKSTGLELKFHTGVTKILNKGQQTLKDKLVNQHGKTEGEKKLKEIYSRGNKTHANIEKNKESHLSKPILAELGSHLGDEVLVYANLLGKNIIGFIDSVWINEDSSITLVDYKTKKNKYSFERYSKAQSVNTCFNQLVAYAILFKATYNTDIESVKMVTIFLDGKDEPSIFELHRSQFLPYASHFKNQILL